MLEKTLIGLPFLRPCVIDVFVVGFNIQLFHCPADIEGYWIVLFTVCGRSKWFDMLSFFWQKIQSFDKHARHSKCPILKSKIDANHHYGGTQTAWKQIISKQIIVELLWMEYDVEIRHDWLMLHMSLITFLVLLS